MSCTVAGSGLSGREFRMSEQERRSAQGADYENVGADYLEQRQLQKGAAGWVLLAGLGVAYVISGDFAGWHFGLAEGGWGGLLIATVLMATMYTAMVFALAELSSTIPTAGGGYGFARRAMGPWGGFMTGAAILIEYAIAPAAIATFIGGYVETLTGIGGWIVYLACYLIFVGIHLYGVGEALKLMFAITVVAVVALAAFVIGMIPQFEVANLFNIDPTNAAGASSFLPFGVVGIWAAFPFAIWFFLAIEGVPLAAEETRDPSTDMPKGLIGGMAALLLFAVLVLLFGPGGAGSVAFTSDEMLASPSVLPLALEEAYGGGNALVTLINIAVFGATISYALMMLSHIVLRQREPDLERPYRTPGGVATSGVALVLAVLAVIPTFFVDVRAALITLGVSALFLAYFGLYSRHHLVAQAPEEEFATIEQAESELAGS